MFATTSPVMGLTISSLPAAATLVASSRSLVRSSSRRVVTENKPVKSLYPLPHDSR